MMKRIVIGLILLLFAFPLCPPLAAEEKWKGIDETVVQKYAQERGQQAAEPLFDPEGDLLLFLFALAGGVGGFIMGYFWHKVFAAGRKDAGKRE